MAKKKKYKFTLAILSIFNNLWTRLSFEALHNRVIDSTITTYHHLSRLVPSRTSGRRSREAVVTAIHASIVCSAFLHIYIYIWSVPLSFIYLASPRKLWNHARVSFKQINKRRSKRSGTSRFPSRSLISFRTFVYHRGLFSHDITVYNRDGLE